MKPLFQFDLAFKVLDANDQPLADTKIKIKNDEGEAEVTTDAKGEAKTAEKYNFGTKFTTVEVSKIGYSLTTDVAAGITVKESDNTFTFKLKIKSVSNN